MFVLEKLSLNLRMICVLASWIYVHTAAFRRCLDRGKEKWGMRHTWMRNKNRGGIHSEVRYFEN